MPMQEITMENYMEDLELINIPLWVSFSGLPVDYLNWEAFRGIVNMVGSVNKDTLVYDHARRNLGYNARIWFDTRRPLPSGVKVMLANGK